MTRARLQLELCAITLLAISGVTRGATTDTRPLYESRPPSHRPADPHEGLLVVSLTANATRFEGVDALIVDSGSERYRLRTMASTYARDLSVFVGVLPEGVYSVQALEERDSFRTLTLTDANRAMLGTFAVRPRERCDLGRLVTTQMGFAFATGRSDTLTSNVDELGQFAPDSAALFPSGASCWSTVHSDTDIVERYARFHPVGAAIAAELPDGRVAMPTGMGSVLIRAREGTWSVAHSEGMQRLLYVDHAAEAGMELIAVGELNTLLRLGDDGQLHRMNPGNLPLGTILFIDGTPAAGWHIVHQRGNDLRIYRSDDLARPVWTEIAAATTDVSFWSGANNFWVWPTANGFAYAMTNQGAMHFYDYASKTWTERHTPKNSAILGIAHSPGDVIGVLTSPGAGFGGITASQYYSRDYGATWTELMKSPYAVKVAPPRVLADNTLLVNGGVFGDTGLQASGDGGKTWTKLTDKIGVRDFYWNLPGAGLLNISGGADVGIERITHSADAGRTWTTEYMSVDPEIIRAELEAERAKDEAKKVEREARRKRK
jgi:hypothetical protein